MNLNPLPNFFKWKELGSNQSHVLRKAPDPANSPSVGLLENHIGQFTKFETFADGTACGMDLVEFVLEEKSNNSEAKGIKKAEIKVLQKAKAQAIDIQVIKYSQKTEKTITKSKDAFVYQCPFCDFTTHSLKSLSGHRTGDPAKKA